MIKLDWERAIETEWKRRSLLAKPGSFFPLICQSFDHREILAATRALLTSRLTMGEQVLNFERQFARYVGARYAVMVNSGSSANLLALAAASNPARKRRLRVGDEVLVPAVCWPTSLWPIVQMGLKPVFVDVIPETLNIDPEDIRRKLTRRTRALMAVHILGNSAPMAEVLRIVRERELLLIEDTCESLGSHFRDQCLGTLGDFGCYSFYYSHHITTGEGGMVACRRLEDYDLLKCLRAHGWSRELSNRTEVERRHKDIDPRFLFVNLGYNLRPTEVQAAFGACQLTRLSVMNRARNHNRQTLITALSSHRKWHKQFSFPIPARHTQPVWFGFPCLLNSQYAKCHQDFLHYLSTHGVENRVIVSGNFIRQPAIKLLGLKFNPKDFPGAEEINNRGFFIGLHSEPLEAATICRLVEIMLGYEFP